MPRLRDGMEDQLDSVGLDLKSSLPSKAAVIGHHLGEEVPGVWGVGPNDCD